MSPFRSWYVDLARQLALRLERLEESLTAFKDRLRIVLADAIGRFVGDGIRDAVDGAFTALSGRSPDALGAPVGYAASSMDLGDGDGNLLDSREACFSYRSDSAPGAISCARSSQANASRSLLDCVAAILRTSIVWAPLQGPYWGWRTSVTLAVCVGGLALLAPPLSDAVLGLFALLPWPTLTEAIRAVAMS
jgi:hypothetical protein